MTLPPYLPGLDATKRYYEPQARYETARRRGQVQVAAPSELPASVDGLRNLEAPLLLLGPSVPRVGMQRLLQRLQIDPERPNVRSSLFSTGDRFTEIYGDYQHRTVVVAQGVGRGPLLCDQLMDALQTVWAARHAEAADDTTLLLPIALDPQLYPTPLNRLVARLAKVSGAKRVCYVPELTAFDPGAKGSPGLSTRWTARRAARALQRDVERTEDPAALQAILRVATSQAKHVGRRRVADAAPQREARWLRVASEAADKLRCARPAAAERPQYVVLTVHTGSELPTSLVAELKERGDDVTLGRHTFDQEEGRVTLDPDTQLTGKRVVIVSNTRPNPEYASIGSAAAPTFEALLLLQRARDLGAQHVTHVVAYMANSRSDRKFDRVGDKSHFPPYAALVANWLKSLKPDAHILIEAHDMHTISVLLDPKRGSLYEIGGMEILLDRKLGALDQFARDRAVLAWPDAGSRRRGEDIERRFRDRVLQPGEDPQFARRVVVCDKVHNPGHDTGVNLSTTSGRIDPDAHVYLPDDEVGSGRTLAGTLALLKQRGAGTGSGKLHAMITHNNLPLDLVQRNLLYAWFRDSGASSLSFLDTQPTGTVVQGYTELASLGATDDVIERFCAERSISHWSPTRYQELFQGLDSFVEVVSVAPNVADRMSPRPR